MMLHKLATPLLQSVTDRAVKRHTDYLAFLSDKQIFTLAFTWTSFDDRVDAGIKAKHFHRWQPANAFCPFALLTPLNVSLF